MAKFKRVKMILVAWEIQNKPLYWPTVTYSTSKNICKINNKINKQKC